MAACKSAVDPNGIVRIPSASLPITCKLQAPPNGVSMGTVEFFPSGSSKPTSYAITNGQSFSIPAMPQGAKGDLYVRIGGPYDGANPLWVVEDCDGQSPILAITSSAAKYASTQLEVF
jgi:hypothetical protein